MAEIIFLGTAASQTSAYRDTTSLLFNSAGQQVLIDCGGSIVKKLAELNFNFLNLENLIITHQHLDHFYGILHLIHAQAHSNKKMNIFTNAPTQKLLAKVFKTLGLDKTPYPKLKFKNVFSKKIFLTGKTFQFQAVKNNHKPGSFGVLLNYRNKKILYSSDTALSPTIIKAATDCSYLIHDCTASATYFKKNPNLTKMHTCAATLADTFKASQLKKVIPIHFLLEKKGEEERIRKELKPLGKKLWIPRDNDRLKI
jgi:ribonuclease BN (tRNA processing enzyme)